MDNYNNFLSKIKKYPLFMGIVRKAIIYDKKGNWYKTVNITHKHNFFYVKDRAYNIILEGSYFRIKGVLWNTDYYFYNIDNANPYIFDKNGLPVLNTILYNVNLKTEVAKKLNDANKYGWLSELMTPRNIIIGIILIAVIYYFSTGGTITPNG
jgi:hypothetical protein